MDGWRKVFHVYKRIETIFENNSQENRKIKIERGIGD
jgi:hypothetical protein